MEGLLTQLRPTQPLEPLTICLMAEDFAATARAEAWLKGLSHQVAAAREFSKRVWTASELRMPRLRGIAAEEAATAEWVVLSLRYADDLSCHVHSWLAAMAEKREAGRGVLVLLLQCLDSEVSTALRSALDQTAARTGMRLVVHFAPMDRASADEQPV